MEMKSIRLDFPADEAYGFTDKEIKDEMVRVFAANCGVEPPLYPLMLALTKAAMQSHVNDFDDGRRGEGDMPTGGPVFYIP